MKLILLRHEERGIDIGFYSNLTENGINNACTSLPNKLKSLNIDFIFSSPFMRTIETIYPFAYSNNISINIEYALYEYIHNPYFLLSEWYYTIDDIKDFKDMINMNYNSIINKNNFSILEDEISLSKRIIPFINYLKENFNDKTILLVSHKGVINKIIDLYVKKNSLENNIQMGSIHIYNI
jgi:broad specificity phosphatase PhoE